MSGAFSWLCCHSPSSYRSGNGQLFMAQSDYFICHSFQWAKTHWLIVPGLLIALTGVCWVLGGENGLNSSEIINNIASSPLSYFLAFLGAFIWAAYCTVTNKYAHGYNGITVFVLLTAMALWLYYFLTPQPAMTFSLPVMVKLFSAALTLGFAYAAWNVGILHGNVTIMAVGSYFTPVMSSALAALLLRSPCPFPSGKARPWCVLVPCFAGWQRAEPDRDGRAVLPQN